MKRACTTPPRSADADPASMLPLVYFGTGEALYVPFDIWSQIVRHLGDEPTSFMYNMADYHALACTCRSIHAQIGGIVERVEFALWHWDRSPPNWHDRHCPLTQYLSKPVPLVTFLPRAVCTAAVETMRQDARELLHGFALLDFLDAQRPEEHAEEPCAHLVGGLATRLLVQALRKVGPAGFLTPTIERAIDVTSSGGGWGGTPDVDLLLEPRYCQSGDATRFKSWPESSDWKEDIVIGFPAHTPEKFLDPAWWGLADDVPQAAVKYCAMDDMVEYTLELPASTSVPGGSPPPSSAPRVVKIQQMASCPFWAIGWSRDDMRKNLHYRVEAVIRTVEFGFDLSACQCLYEGGLGGKTLVAPGERVFLSRLAMYSLRTGRIRYNPGGVRHRVHVWHETCLQPMFDQPRWTSPDARLQAARACVHEVHSRIGKAPLPGEPYGLLHIHIYKHLQRIRKYEQRGYRLDKVPRPIMESIYAAADEGRARVQAFLRSPTNKAIKEIELLRQKHALDPPLDDDRYAQMQAASWAADRYRLMWGAFEAHPDKTGCLTEPVYYDGRCSVSNGNVKVITMLNAFLHTHGLTTPNCLESHSFNKMRFDRCVEGTKNF